MSGADPLLAVDDLHTRFGTPDGAVHAVDGVSLTVREGELVGIVGESGSGKSALALSTMRLESPGRIVSGSVRYRGTDLVTADDRTVRRVRGRGMAMVFQDPTSTLNPVFPVGEQIAESLKVHEDPDDQRLADYLPLPGLGTRPAWRRRRERAVELMEQVGIPHADARADAHPHEFSGGMRQRVMVAIALAREPDLLIADEPTTALDVTVQAQVLERLRSLSERHGMAVLFVSHDLGVVAELADRIVVLYGGQVMEEGPTDRLLSDPRHPYTRALLRCHPRNAARGEELEVIDGQVPDLVGGSDGCPFAPRCGRSRPACSGDALPGVSVGPDHRVRCVDAAADTDGGGGGER